MKRKFYERRPVLTRVSILASVMILAVGMMSVVFSQSSRENQSTQDRSKSPAGRRVPNLNQLARPADDDTRTYVAERNITIDAKTGRLRKPTPEETKELVDSLRSLTNRSSKGLTAVTRPDGTRQVNLQGRFGNAVIARPNPDGTMETRCVTTFEEAAEFLGLRPETASEAAAREAVKKTNE
jgi:hypothetical protein